MTTFSSSQQNESQQKQQYQTSIGSTMVNTSPRNQQSSPKGFTIQRPSLGLHQNGSLSTMDSSPYYTTTKQNNVLTTSGTGSFSPVSESGQSCSDNTGAIGEPGMTDDEDDYDEDDVEIIMHEGNGSHNSTDSGIDNDSTPPINSSPAAAAPCQHHRQQPSSDRDHPSSQESKHHPLQRQLEFYFSRQNLANDAYLVSQMDLDLYVPIATIAKFKRVQDITSDLDYIVSTLRHSLAVTVDESGTKVKPNISLQRTTVILREMPDATEKEIDHFLQGLDSPPVKGIKNEYGNMWYITFHSEDDALKFLYDTRGKSFKGQQVAARMKSEPVVGSIQARKSALQAESSSSTIRTTMNSTYHGQDQHPSIVNNSTNMKNSNYNGYYYTYNSPTSFRHQYGQQYPNHHGGSYTNYSSNGGQRSGKFINNNNGNRRPIRGGRGRHTTNSRNGYGGIGQNIAASVISASTTTPSTETSPLTSFESHTGSDRSWTHRYNWQGAPKSQQYRHSRSTPTNEQSDTTGSINDTHDGNSTELSSSSSNASSQASQHTGTFKRHTYYQQSSNYYRGQRNGNPHQPSTSWKRYNNGNTTNLQQQHHPTFDSSGQSAFTTRIYSNRSPKHQHSSPPPPANTAPVSLKTSSSTPDTKPNSISATESLTYRKNTPTHSSSSSESTQVLATTKTAAPIANGHPSVPPAVTTTSESVPGQEDRKNQNDNKGKRKSKWDKKRRTRKSSGDPSTTTDDKPQEQPDLQSGTYFPPLPGTKDIVGGATVNTPPPLTNVPISIETPRSHEMTVSDLLEERLSAAEIVKKGHDGKLKKTPSASQMNGSSTTSTTSTVTNQQKQRPVKETPPTEAKDNKSQQTSTSGNEESFPQLCSTQDLPPAATNFSYADMLKRKENGTK